MAWRRSTNLGWQFISVTWEFLREDTSSIFNLLSWMDDEKTSFSNFNPNFQLQCFGHKYEKKIYLTCSTENSTHRVTQK